MEINHEHDDVGRVTNSFGTPSPIKSCSVVDLNAFDCYIGSILLYTCVSGEE